MNYSENCRNRMAHLNASFLISNGEGYYELDGKRYSIDEFAKSFPVPTNRIKDGNKKSFEKGNNPDKKNSWKNF